MLTSQGVLEQVHSLHKKSLTLPASFRSSRAAVAHALKLRTIYPLHEEDYDPPESDLQPPDPPLPSTPPQYDTSQLSQELECAKRLHQADKDFYGREIDHLRFLLLDAEQTVRDLKDLNRRQSLEYDKVVRRKQALIDERNELRAYKDQLLAELDARKKEFLDAMDVLEATEREIIDDPLRKADMGHLQKDNINQVSRPGANPPEPKTIMLERYAVMPARVADMRQKLADSEEHFQLAYAAWTQSSRHQRRLSLTAVQDVSGQIKRHEDQIKELASDNQRLSAQVSSLSDRLVFSSKELESARRELRIAQFRTAIESRGSLEEAVCLVRNLNACIHDTASRLAACVQPHHSDMWASVADTVEARLVLGGQIRTSLFTMLHNGSPVNSKSLTEIFLQIALTSWCAGSIHSWDLDLNRSSESGNALLAVYRRLKTVEDPMAVARWRSLAYAQIRFSSQQWVQSLTTSLNSVLKAMCLTYTEPEWVIEHVLQPLISSVRAVRRALGETIVDHNLEVTIVPPSTRLDAADDVDAFQTDEVVSAGSDTVIGTMALGLKTTTPDELILFPVVLRESHLPAT